MKTLILSLLLLTGTMLTAQINVTFRVDMEGVVVSADGVHIAGSLNGWNTSANMLTDMDGDNIYEVTLTLDADADYEYKYLNGNVWGTEESPPMECAVGGNNRIFTTALTDMVLPVIPFSGCPTPNPTQEVTFTVDMQGQTISPDGVHIAGNFNGWNPTSTEMTLLGNDFYQVTVTVLSSLTTVQYKYLNGSGWGNEETIPAACVNSSNNRFYVIDGQGAAVTLPAFQYGTCTESAISLPVNLMKFTGALRDGKSWLSWETASEINNEGFEVEHSINGQQWNVLDFVVGYGTTSVSKRYEFMDDGPSKGTNYYRLRQIDFDGKYEYSDILTLYVDKEERSTFLYPNPAADVLNIDNVQGQVALYNMLGQPVLTKNVGSDNFQLDVSILQAGSYILNVIRQDGKVTNHPITISH